MSKTWRFDGENAIVMKPDQHKKKKNAQYKKSHGIVDTKTEIEITGEGKKKGKGSKKLADKKPVGDPGPGVQRRTAPLKSDSDSATSEDDVAGGSVPSGKTFRRRVIESNWQRYEGLEVAADDTQSDGLRGEDMRQLLAVTSSAMSQFRFRDEQDWDDDAGQMTNEAAKLLSIDTEALAEALQCVPLHVRLSVEPEAFQAEQVERFIEHAEEKQHSFSKIQDMSVHDKHHETVTPLIPDKSIQRDAATVAMCDLTSPLDDALDDILGESATAEGPSSLSSTLILKSNRKGVEKTDPVTSGDLGETKPFICDNTVGDVDDLDNILKLMDKSVLSDNTLITENITDTEQLMHTSVAMSPGVVAEPIKTMNKSYIKEKEKPDSLSDKKRLEEDQATKILDQHKAVTEKINVSSLEDDLDELLSLDFLAKSSAPSNTAQTDAGGGLEDWLDSMLDD